MRGAIIWLLIYVAVEAALAGALVAARQRVLQTQTSATAQQQWDQWRDEAQRQAQGTGPVERRVPQAAQSPSLLLLRDHFAACLALAWMLSTVLMATLIFMIRGVASGSTYRIDTDRDPL